MLCSNIACTTINTLGSNCNGVACTAATYCYSGYCNSNNGHALCSDKNCLATYLAGSVSTCNGITCASNNDCWSQYCNINNGIDICSPNTCNGSTSAYSKTGSFCNGINCTSNSDCWTGYCNPNLNMCANVICTSSEIIASSCNGIACGNLNTNCYSG